LRWSLSDTVLLQYQDAVGAAAREDFAGAIGPVDGDLIDLLAGTESEVQGLFAGRLVAASTVEEGRESAICGGNGHDGSDCGPLSAVGQQWSNLQPVAVGHFVFQQERGLIEAGDEEIEVPVSIDISCCEAACDGFECTEFVRGGGFFEVVALAQQQQLLLAVSLPEVAGIGSADLSADSAVHGNEIEVSVVIQVGQGGAESGEGKGYAVHLPCG